MQRKTAAPTDTSAPALSGTSAPAPAAPSPASDAGFLAAMGFVDSGVSLQEQSAPGTIHRKAEGNGAATGDPGKAFESAVSGSSTALPHRASMEQSFGADLGQVEAHVGTPEAQQGLAALGAEAAASGNQVAFMDATPSVKTVAHETAHVVQAQGAGQSTPATLSSPSQASEREADAAADAVSSGRASQVSAGAAPGTIHRSLLGGIIGGIGGAIGGAVVGGLVGGPLGAIAGGIMGAVGGAAVGDSVSTRSRALTADEIAYATEIFGTSVDYSAIKITRDSMMSTGAPKTIGNTIHLLSDWGGPIFTSDESMELTAKGKELLIHEMGHVWQYQNGGLAYIGDSLWAQLKGTLGSGSRNAAYDWREAHNAGTPWEEWNPEQQAEAIEEYNKALRRAKDGTATADDHRLMTTLQPYMDKVRNGEGAPQFSTAGAVGGGLIGAGMGALIGGAVGGPVGALVGAGLGGLAGAIFGGG